MKSLKFFIKPVHRVFKKFLIIAHEKYDSTLFASTRAMFGGN